MTVGDKSGNPVVLAHSTSDPVFSAAFSVPAAQYAAGVLVSFTGAAGFVTRIKWIKLTLRAGSVANATQNVTLERRSTATTGGATTATTTTLSKNDPVNDITTQQTTVTHYYNATPSAPTAGTLTATMRTEPLAATGATTDATNTVVEWNFTTRGEKPITLRGTSDFVTLSLSNALSTAQTLGVEYTFEEATT